MEHFSDVELILAYKSGNKPALAFLINRYLKPIYNFLLRMTNNTGIAEDLTQETFIKAWQKLNSFKSEKSFQTWLFTIAKNTAIDNLRKKHPKTFSDLGLNDNFFSETLPDNHPTAEEFLLQKENHKQIYQALAQLPPKARSVVVLHQFEDMTFQDIADVLEEPMNTTKSRYRRALISLRAILEYESGAPN